MLGLFKHPDIEELLNVRSFQAQTKLCVPEFYCLSVRIICEGTFRLAFGF